MRNRDLQNERLDQIGCRLLKTVRLSSDEIENIAASPQLFDSVLTRIKAQDRLRKEKKPMIGMWLVTAFLYRQKAVGAFAVVTFLLGSATLFTFQHQNLSGPGKQTTKLRDEEAFSSTESLLPSPEIEKVKMRETKTRLRGEKAVLKIEQPKSANRARKQLVAKPVLHPPKEQPEVFYSLTFPGDWESGDEILQVVRTEISRSELFALGVDLPIENESAKVKTDLLVGGDGVARAIKFVE